MDPINTLPNLVILHQTAWLVQKDKQTLPNYQALTWSKKKEKKNPTPVKNYMSFLRLIGFHIKAEKKKKKKKKKTITSILLNV